MGLCIPIPLNAGAVDRLLAYIYVGMRSAQVRGRRETLWKIRVRVMISFGPCKILFCLYFCTRALSRCAETARGVLCIGPLLAFLGSAMPGGQEVSVAASLLPREARLGPISDEGCNRIIIEE